MCHMQVLGLQNNKIGDVGVTALANACATGTMAHLNKIYLSSNPISDESKGTMRSAMSKRRGQVYL